jgi:tellurite methyltransferase
MNGSMPVDHHGQRPFWESAYASEDDEVETFGPPNPELVDLLIDLPVGGRVLDAGCGEGRLALFFARHGFDVVAFDASVHGIAKLNRLASKENLPVRAFVQDLREYQPHETFDLVVADGVLHLVEKPHADRMIREWQAATKPGGWNLIKWFTTRVAPPPDLVPFHIGLREEGELAAFYEGWDFRLNQSFLLHDEHPGGIRHCHPINKILARKP